MASEETPLLTHQVILDHEAVYNRFTPGHKRLIVAITALVGTFPSVSLCSYQNFRKMINLHLKSVYTSGMFVPLIPQIARDLDSTPSVIR